MLRELRGHRSPRAMPELPKHRLAQHLDQRILRRPHFSNSKLEGHQRNRGGAIRLWIKLQIENCKSKIAAHSIKFFSNTTRLSACVESHRMPTMSYPKAMAKWMNSRWWFMHSQRM